MHEVEIIPINNLAQAREQLEKIGVDKGGMAVMIPKAVHMVIKLTDIKVTPANIIKQEMLSIGGDAAVHRGTINHSIEKTDVLLMGTVAQYRKLVKKLVMQPFGLKQTAAAIVEMLKSIEQEAEYHEKGQ